MTGPSRLLRVAFVPRYRGNPYLTQLEDALRAVGVEVEPYGGSARSLLAGLLRRPPHVLHLQWLDAFFTGPNTPIAWGKFLAFRVMIGRLRRRGVRIVWTVHNLHDHECRYPRFDHACTQFVLDRADAVIIHGPSARRLLGERFRLAHPDRIHVVPHGHYRDAYPCSHTRESARRELRLRERDFVYLFLGQIRPYKGTLELMEAFRSVPGDDTRLIVAGKARDDDYGRRLDECARQDPRILYEPAFIPDDRIQVYMQAADVVVFPYRDILTSGGVILAMSFGKPCIAPRMGCIPDVLDPRGAFLYDAADADALPRAMRSARERKHELRSMGAHNRRKTEAFSWHGIAVRLRDIYEHLF